MNKIWSRVFGCKNTVEGGMIAYLECGRCGKQSSLNVNGVVKCPHCKSKEVKRMSMGGDRPWWFKG